MNIGEKPNITTKVQEENGKKEKSYDYIMEIMNC